MSINCELLQDVKFEVYIKGLFGKKRVLLGALPEIIQSLSVTEEAIKLTVQLQIDCDNASSFGLVDADPTMLIFVGEVIHSDVVSNVSANSSKIVTVSTTSIPMETNDNYEDVASVLINSDSDRNIFGTDSRASVLSTTSISGNETRQASVVIDTNSALDSFLQEYNSRNTVSSRDVDESDAEADAENIEEAVSVVDSEQIISDDSSSEGDAVEDQTSVISFKNTTTTQVLPIVDAPSDSVDADSTSKVTGDSNRDFSFDAISSDSESDTGRGTSSIDEQAVELSKESSESSYTDEILQDQLSIVMNPLKTPSETPRSSWRVSSVDYEQNSLIDRQTAEKKLKEERDDHQIAIKSLRLQYEKKIQDLKENLRSKVEEVENLRLRQASASSITPPRSGSMHSRSPSVEGDLKKYLGIISQKDVTIAELNRELSALKPLLSATKTELDATKERLSESENEKEKLLLMIAELKLQQKSKTSVQSTISDMLKRQSLHLPPPDVVMPGNNKERNIKAMELENMRRMNIVASECELEVLSPLSSFDNNNDVGASMSISPSKVTDNPIRAIERSSDSLKSYVPHFSVDIDKEFTISSSAVSIDTKDKILGSRHVKKKSPPPSIIIEIPQESTVGQSAPPSDANSNDSLARSTTPSPALSLLAASANDSPIQRLRRSIKRPLSIKEKRSSARNSSTQQILDGFTGTANAVDEKTIDTQIQLLTSSIDLNTRPTLKPASLAKENGSTSTRSRSSSWQTAFVAGIFDPADDTPETAVSKDMDTSVQVPDTPKELPELLNFELPQSLSRRPSKSSSSNSRRTSVKQNDSRSQSNSPLERSFSHSSAVPVQSSFPFSPTGSIKSSIKADNGEPKSPAKGTDEEKASFARIRGSVAFHEDNSPGEDSYNANLRMTKSELQTDNTRSSTNIINSSIGEIPVDMNRKSVFLLSTQRRQLQYFPLELTKNDYLHRLFELLADAIRSKVVHIFQSINAKSASILDSSMSPHRDSPNVRRCTYSASPGKSSDSRRKSTTRVSLWANEETESPQELKMKTLFNIDQLKTDAKGLLAMILSYDVTDTTVVQFVRNEIAKTLKLDDVETLIQCAAILRNTLNRMSSETDTSKLSNVTGIFDAARQLIIMFGKSNDVLPMQTLDGSNSPTVTGFSGSTSGSRFMRNIDDYARAERRSIAINRSRIYVDSATTESTLIPHAAIAINILNDLEEQLNLHRMYKEQRMKSAGWTWDNDEAYTEETVWNSSESAIEAIPSNRKRNSVTFSDIDLLPKSSSIDVQLENKDENGFTKDINNALSYDFWQAMGAPATGNMDSVQTFKPNDVLNPLSLGSHASSDKWSEDFNSSENNFNKLLKDHVSENASNVQVDGLDKSYGELIEKCESLRAHLSLALSPVNIAVYQLMLRFQAYADYLIGFRDYFISAGRREEAKFINDLVIAIEVQLQIDLKDIHANEASIHKGINANGSNYNRNQSDSGGFASPRSKKFVPPLYGSDASLDLESAILKAYEDLDKIAGGTDARQPNTRRGSLSKSASLTKPEKGIDLVDRMAESIKNCDVLITELKFYQKVADSRSAHGNYIRESTGYDDNYDYVQSVITDLISLQKTLEDASTPVLLSDHEDINACLMSRTTPLNGIAKLLFNKQIGAKNLSVAVLLIQAQSLTLIKSVYSKWPNLTLRIPANIAMAHEIAEGNIISRTSTDDSIKSTNATKRLLDTSYTSKSSTRSESIRTSIKKETTNFGKLSVDRAADGRDNNNIDSGNEEYKFVVLLSHDIDTSSIDFNQPKTLRQVGFHLQHLLGSGCYNGKQLLSAGFSPQDFKSVKGLDINVRDLRAIAGYNVTQCKKLGFDAEALLAGGFTSYDLIYSGHFTPSHLKRLGCDLQRFALMALFEKTDGKHWKNNYNWGSAKPVKEWFGIFLDGDGNVMKIDLRSNFLNGNSCHEYRFFYFNAFILSIYIPLL